MKLAGALLSFLAGCPLVASPAAAQQGAEVTGEKVPMSASAARTLGSEINRQLKPFWKAPEDTAAGQLATTIAVDLNRDGSIARAPRVVSQSGVTPSNNGQKQLHAENAINAVTRAAPFRLPPDLYDAWRSLEIKFDKRLSQ